MKACPFELHVISAVPRGVGRIGEDEYGLALYQQPVRARIRSSREETSQPNPLPHPEGTRERVRGESCQLVVRLWGTAFRAIVDRVLAALKDNGYRASELSRTRKAPFLLSEESGVRLGLLFLAVKPLRKLSRIEAISGAIWAMSPEEAYYWFSKCTDHATAGRAQRAIRILLARE